MSDVLAKLAALPAMVGEGAMWDGVPVHTEDGPTARVMPFADRATAGALLAQAMPLYAGKDALVLGVTNGGLVVAQALAHALRLPLDAWVVRPIKQPLDPNPLGVIAEGPSVKLERRNVRRSGLTNDEVRSVVRTNVDQMIGEARRLRRKTTLPEVANRTVILVDEGIARSDVLAVAIDGVRRRGASFVVAASPVGANASLDRLEELADDVICLMTPDVLTRAGAWYRDYRRISDLAAMKILAAVTAS
jgi:putative phosphoribosyl transferase